MKNFQLLLIIITCFVLFSCSKEEEVVVSEPTVPSYDLGHLTVKMKEVTFGVDPTTYITDIELTNLTKGTDLSINPGLFTYIQQDGYSLLTTTFANGNNNDQLQCCINFSSAINVDIGIRFEDISPDSIATPTISSNSYCAGGIYQ